MPVSSSILIGSVTNLTTIFGALLRLPNPNPNQTVHGDDGGVGGVGENVPHRCPHYESPNDTWGAPHSHIVARRGIHHHPLAAHIPPGAYSQNSQIHCSQAAVYHIQRTPCMLRSI